MDRTRITAPLLKVLTSPLVVLTAAAVTLGTLGRRYVAHTYMLPPPRAPTKDNPPQLLTVIPLDSPRDSRPSTAGGLEEGPSPSPGVTAAALLATISDSNTHPLRLLMAKDPLFAALSASQVDELIAAGDFVHYDPGSPVWAVGDPDVYVYIVLSGELVISSSGKLLRRAKTGEVITSIMSVLEVLGGLPSDFKTVTACASSSESLSMLRIPASAFEEAAVSSHLLEAILLKLSKVTFLTLYAYLGLTSELVKSPGDDPGASATAPGAALESQPVSSLDAAAAQMCAVLGIADNPALVELVGGAVSLRQGQRGTILIPRGSPDSELCLVLSGSVTLSMVTPHREPAELYTARPGELFGQLAVASRDSSLIEIEANDPGCVIATLPRSVFWELVALEPRVLQTTALSVLERLSPLVRCLDFALDWVHVMSGQWLYAPGDASDAVYIVLSGRMRGMRGTDESSEFGRGETVGEVEMLAGTRRSVGASAIRDSHLVRIPRETFRFICGVYPDLALRFAERMGRTALAHTHAEPNSGRTNTVRTIAVVPLASHSDGLVDGVADALRVELSRVTSDPIAYVDGLDPAVEGVAHNSTHAQKVALMDRLSRLEDSHGFVVYVAKCCNADWLGIAMRQADVVLFVADAQSDPAEEAGGSEDVFRALGVATRTELVLVHPSSTVLPSGTPAWLKDRPWIAAHHHCRAGNLMHIGRMARRVTGAAVGVVLGGGGAKGLSHLGMLQEFENRGVCVDVVCGTSIGACIGGLYAMEENAAAALQRIMPFTRVMASKWRKVFDLTYPATAIFTGRAFNRALVALLGEDVDITDLWIPFFCVSTDLTRGRAAIHEDGSLWRYCRASMTLTGYLPPLCDPVNGHLLCDGGYVNNCPADVLASRFAPKAIHAIDVGAKEDREVTFYGDELSGWYVLWKRIYPFTASPAIPSMAEISSSLAYVTGRVHLEDHVLGDSGDNGLAGRLTYYAPPIQGFQTLDFDLAQEIYQVGVDYGRTAIKTDDHLASASASASASSSSSTTTSTSPIVP